MVHTYNSQYSQLAEHHNPPNSVTPFLQAIINDTTGEPLEFWHLIQSLKYKHIWEMALVNELVHLSQGIWNLPGTDTINFIHKYDIPSGQTPTYGQIVADYQL